MLQFFQQTITIIVNFQIQFLTAVLMFIPFLARRKKFVLRFISIIIPYVILSYVLFFTPLNSYLRLNNGFSFVYAILFALIVFMLVFCFKMSLLHALFYATASYCMQHAVYCFCKVIQIVFKLNWFSWQNYLIVFFSCAIIYMIFYFIFVRRIKKGEKIGIENKKLIFISVAGICIFYVLDMLSLNIYFAVQFHLYAVCSCLLLLFLQFGMFERSKLQRQNEMMHQILHAEQTQHKISKENIDFINMKCHDLKHQISVLRSSGDIKGQEKTLEELEKSVLIYDSVAKTGNAALDIVLTEKNLYCEKYNIKLNVMADGSKLEFMSAVDIYSLFGNALDNAVESVIKIPETEKRCITLNISAKDAVLSVHFENYYEQPIIFEDGIPVTTKENARFHGFGMKSIRFIVEKYNGTMTIMAEDNFFNLNIIFPIQ